MANQTVTKKYRELLDYCNSLRDQSARNAVAPELEQQSLQQHAAVRNAAAAAENVRQWQRRLTEVESERAAAQANLNVLTDRWEAIRKQIEDLK